MKKIFLLIFTLFFIITSAYAIQDIELMNTVMPIKEGAILNLDDCIDIALSRSPNIKNMRNYWKQAKHNVSIAKSEYFPTLSAGVGYNQGWTRARKRTDNNRVLPSVDARLREMIWNFGKTNANIRMEKFYKIAAEHDFNQEVIDTIYTVKVKYYAVLAAQALVEIERANVQINERNYQRTKAYFDEGIRSRIDLVNAEVYLSDSKIGLVKAENDYKNAIIALNNSMYVAKAPSYTIKHTDTFNFNLNYIPVSLVKVVPPNDNYKLPKDVQNATLTANVEKAEKLQNYVFKKYPMTFEESLQFAYDNRYDLKSLEATKKAIQQALLYTKREYYPEIVGSIGYGYRDTRITDSNSFEIGVEISSSLNPFQTKHKIDRAKLQVQIAQNNIDEFKQDLYFDIQKTYVDMLSLEKQIPLNEVKVRQTLENLELADGRYEVGLGDFIQVQDAKVNYNNAQNTYIKTIFNYNVSRATLEREICSEKIKIKLDDNK